MNAFQGHSLAESRIDTVVVQMKRRARHFHCIPLPPGCIPTEMITEGSQQHALHPTSSFAQCEMGQIPVQPDASKYTGENNQEREKVEQDDVISAKVQNRRRNMQINVLYNNWVNPNF